MTEGLLVGYVCPDNPTVQPNDKVELLLTADLAFLFQVLFCAGAVIVIGCATWFYFTPQSQRDMIYAPTIIMGAGNSMMLVTSLAMVAEIIGDDKVGLPSQNIS